MSIVLISGIAYQLKICHSCTIIFTSLLNCSLNNPCVLLLSPDGFALLQALDKLLFYDPVDRNMSNLGVLKDKYVDSL